MRLGGFFDEKFQNPEEWITILQTYGYKAAYCPFRPAPGSSMPSDSVIAEYRRAAEQADIVIAEVGAWGRNYLADNETERKLAIEETSALLDMSEKFNARCVVNSAGWCSNPADNFTEYTFEYIVEMVRKIIDPVKPKNTFFTLELVPAVYPNSIQSYLDLIKAVDRKEFGVHLDPVNIIDNPFKYYRNKEFLKECFKKLGNRIKSCHAKDVILEKGMVVHLSEIRPGLGILDYQTFIEEANKVDMEMPIMLEHLETNEEYRLAAEYVRSCANK